MNYHKIETASIENGIGFRVVLWVSGCEHHCVGCHNPETWDYDSGAEFDEAAMKALLDALGEEWIEGLTLSGGDPLAPGNREDVRKIIAAVREIYPEKTIWLYTGYTTEPEDYDGCVSSILPICDVVVDGEYRKELRDITLPWRGSSNQRVIDVKNTMKNMKIEIV